MNTTTALPKVRKINLDSGFLQVNSIHNFPVVQANIEVNKMKCFSLAWKEKNKTVKKVFNEGV